MYIACSELNKNEAISNIQLEYVPPGTPPLEYCFLAASKCKGFDQCLYPCVVLKREPTHSFLDLRFFFEGENHNYAV
jgi:hypothetical protein